MFAAWPNTTRNKNECVIHCGNGSVIYFTNCQDGDAVQKMMGRSFQFLAMDECGNYTPAGWQACQRLRANLRAKPGQPIRCHATANPMGKLHHKLYKSFVLRAQPWAVFEEEHTGLLWMWCTSDLTQNPHINPEQYEKQIIAATVHDVAKQNAWRYGTWGPTGGNMFALFDGTRHVIEIPDNTFLGAHKTMMALDFGQSAPSVILVGQRLYDAEARLIAALFSSAMRSQRWTAGLTWTRETARHRPHSH